MVNQLPDGWDYPYLDDLLTFKLGGDWGKEQELIDPDYVEVLCIRASELRNWSEEKGSTAALRKIKKSSLTKRELKIGDILVEISGGGPEQPVGRTVLIDKSVLLKNSEYKKVCTNFFRLIRPSCNVNAKYLNIFLQHFYASGKITEFQSGSNNLRNLKFNDYLQVNIPLAPEKEQERIVAKIEELFSELDSGIASLKAARKQLKIYRQALLKHAFEGKLTEQWRKDNADKLETPEQLLARIQTERESRYQQQLNDWKQAVKDWEAKGKEEKKPSKPKKLATLKNISKSELSELTPLPIGWSYVRIGHLIDEPTYGTSAKCEYDSGNTGVLRIPNIKSDAIDDGDLKFASFDEGEIKHFALEEGDLLTIRSNGSISLVGTCALVKEKDTKYIFAGYLIRLRPNQSSIHPSFLLAVLTSHLLRRQIETAAKSTSGVNNINSGELQNLIIPIPTIQEQNELLKHLDTSTPSINATELEIEKQLLKSETLRQSILKKAFSGQLIPQDLNDEPASELLARIQAGKASKRLENKKRD